MRNRYLPLLILLLMSCKDELKSGSVYSGYLRENAIDDEATMVVLKKSAPQPTYVLFRLSESYRSYSAALYWEPCNLPLEFQKDGLDITVSGYSLTPSSGNMPNTTSPPFEIKSIKQR